MKATQIYIFIAICLLEFSCKKIMYFPDKDISISESKFFAHRGGRTSNFRENTLEGIKAALIFNHGVEVDVQISKDESIWLSHSENVIGCNQNLKCFPETRDSEIRSIISCNGSDISYTELDEVYQLVKDSFPNAAICIDLKGWIPCSGNSLDIEGMMRREAQLISIMAKKYNLESQTLIETETSSVLLFIQKKYPEMKLYQTVYGDFERGMLLCLNYGFDGMSFKTNIGESIDKDKVDLLHRKGVRIMTWNHTNSDEAKSYKEFGVDYIQIDL